MYFHLPRFPARSPHWPLLFRAPADPVSQKRLNLNSFLSFPKPSLNRPSRSFLRVYEKHSATRRLVSALFIKEGRPLDLTVDRKFSFSMRSCIILLLFKVHRTWTKWCNLVTFYRNTCLKRGSSNWASWAAFQVNSWFIKPSFLVCFGMLSWRQTGAQSRFNLINVQLLPHHFPEVFQICDRKCTARYLLFFQRTRLCCSVALMMQRWQGWRWFDRQATKCNTVKICTQV